MNVEHTATCDWCRRQVVSFVMPPAMVTVDWQVDGDKRQTFSRVCLFCLTELIKFIAERERDPVTN